MVKMIDNNVKKMVGETFLEIADAIKTGRFQEKVKVGLTILGSEHGVDNLVKGAELAAKDSSDFEIVLIGPKVGDRSRRDGRRNVQEDGRASG